MSARTDHKPRPRRVASDEAHAWARSLNLRNPIAKSVLRALTLYVNGEGSCFVGIDQLAEDTDLSVDTVRRRLVWLQEIGALVRLPQWLDANGRRNSEGRGKRTTDEIRLLLDGDASEIEGRAHGDGSADDDESSPSRQLGQTEGSESDQGSVSPQLAPRQPSQSCEVLISEPEPEQDSPQPPSGGVSTTEGWERFERAWRVPILRQSLARPIWVALKPAEQDLLCRAAQGYDAWLKDEKKPPTRLAAHRFMKERDAWERYAEYAPAAVTASSHPVDSPEGRAITALYDIAGLTELLRATCLRNGVIYLRMAITPRLLALADLPDRARWPVLTKQQAGAWEAWLRDAFPNVRTRHALRAGARAPHAFPPRVDGTWSPSADPPIQPEASDDDLDDFVRAEQGTRQGPC